ncbi:ASCH domain-containing protein [Terrilactibacillus laevilacticus]|uniref:ASCH domain-containing protein n=1 Tax=Terrilactibacillus laevilacticus TaxID=1380157 RepID=A0ABW5PSM4_9BACI|nr:ASCH domain-containing protein [Terrilactibacillus laevilacticus]
MTPEDMWSNYLKLMNKNIQTKRSYDVWSFGTQADELADLVLKEKKTATTSLYYLYEIENEKLPEKGDIGIITNSKGDAKCIIQTKQVDVLPFYEVTSDFAFKEGEGDRSLEYWRKVHIQFFENELKEINKAFSEDMLVVCEEFEMIYKLNHRSDT